MKTASVSAVKRTINPPVVKNGISALLLLLFFAMTLSSAPGQQFIKLNPPGSAYSIASGLNNTGTIVGSYTDAKGVFRGYTYIQGKYKTIVFPGATTFTQASGVNDSNTVVGGFIGKDQLTHGFLLAGKKFERFDLKKGFSTYISGINKGGSLVGYTGNQGADQSFVRIGGKVKVFTVKGNVTYAFGINASNGVVGYFIPPPFSGVHGFYRSADGKTKQLDYPGALETACLAINDSGTIAGYYSDSQNVAHGFTYLKGKFKTVSFPDIAGLNNHGIVVGSYVGSDGKTYGYVAKPRNAAAR